MFKTIDRYIMKKFAMNLLIGSIGATVIFSVFDFITIIEKVTSGELALLDVPYLAIKSVPSIVSYEMLHLSGLIAGLLTMVDLTSHLEIVAMKTSGISFLRIMAAPLVISFLVSSLIFGFTEFVSVGSLKSKQEIYRKLNGTIISRNRNNIYYKSGDRFFRIYNVDGYSNKVLNFQMVDLKDNEVVRIVNAKEGSYDPKTKKWNLKNAVVNLVAKDEIIEHANYDPEVKESIDDFLKYKIISETPSGDRDPYIKSKQLSFKQIRDNITFLEKAGGNYNRLLTHVHHQRIAYPFSIFIMAGIGLAIMSKFSRSGKGKSITVGILIGFSYYVIVEIAKALGFGGLVPMILSAWTPNIIFAAVGVYLFLKADE